MPVLYTKSKIREILKELKIRPLDGRVNASEAAKILSWRAKDEHKIEHEYTPNAVRKHKERLNPIHPLKSGGSVNEQVNLYEVEKVFEIDIEPKRTNSGRVKVAK